MVRKRKWKMLNKLFVSGTINRGFFRKSKDFELVIYFSGLKKLIFEVYSHEGCGLKYLKTPKRKYISSHNDKDIKKINDNSITDKKDYRKGTKSSEKENKTDEWSPIKIHLDYSGIENNLQKFNSTDLIYLKEKIKLV